MASIDMLTVFIAYHHDMTRLVWDSIEQITDQQFLADDPYSRGSIRNLMVHLANTDRNWLTGLQNMPRLEFKSYEMYPDRASVRGYWNSVAAEVAAYVGQLSEGELNQNPSNIPGPRWEVLLHLVNHGTDHRSTVLQRLQAYGAPTFDQDFILWRARA
jgi:uncharacterized damage-inducible protein DinB